MTILRKFPGGSRVVETWKEARTCRRCGKSAKPTMRMTFYDGRQPLTFHCARCQLYWYAENSSEWNSIYVSRLKAHRAAYCLCALPSGQPLAT
jgi:hypothetical protein